MYSVAFFPMRFLADTSNHSRQKHDNQQQAAAISTILSGIKPGNPPTPPKSHTNNEYFNSSSIWKKKESLNKLGVRPSLKSYFFLRLLVELCSLNSSLRSCAVPSRTRLLNCRMLSSSRLPSIAARWR